MSYFTRSSGILNTPHPMNVGIQQALWLDVFDPDTLTFNGPDISQQNDKSGNGNNAVQAVAAEQPLFVSNGLNGRPTIRAVHAGAALGLEISGGINIGLNAPRTLFMVINPTSGFFNSEILGASTLQMIDFAADRIFIRNEPRNIFSAAGTVAQDIPHIIIVTDDGNNDMNAYDGTNQILTNRLSAFNWDMNFNLGIGKDVGGNPNRSFHGDQSAILIFPGVFSTVNRLRILSYLTVKWGF